MKIVRFKYICPKCKKEYYNNILASYSSGFENMAKTFIKNNKTINICENCNIELVKENLIKYYDNNGQYAPITEKVEMAENFDTYDLYLKTIETIRNFFLCNPGGKIEILSQVEETDTEISGSMIVEGIQENKRFELLNAFFDKYNFGTGNRKNIFVKNELRNITNAVILGIYEHLFIDELSGFGEKDISRILYKAN